MTNIIKERKEAFLADLQALLVKHDAYIALEEERSYGYGRGFQTISFCLVGQYEGDEYIPSIDINVGSYFDGKE